MKNVKMCFVRRQEIIGNKKNINNNNDDNNNTKTKKPFKLIKIQL